jgi:hypothetical protein
MEPLTNQDNGLIIENGTSDEMNAVLFMNIEKLHCKRGSSR